MNTKFHLQNRGVRVGDLVCYKGNVLVATSLVPKDRIGVVIEIFGDTPGFPDAHVKFIDDWGQPDDIWIPCNRLLVYK